MTKTEYARHRGVSPAAISNFISRGRLTPPALTPDGNIDAGLADQQLGATLDPMMSASARSRIPQPRSAASLPSAAEPVTRSHAGRLLEARMISAEIRAERDRRELECERGRYLLANKATATWTKTLAGMIQSIEIDLFPDIADTIGLDRAQRIALKKCWHNWRVKWSQDAGMKAAEAPEFAEDPESNWGR